MNHTRMLITRLAACLALATSFAAHGNGPFVTGLQGSQGSTIGPDGALYVTEGAIGQVTRIDLKTGATSAFASGLPPSLIGIGGAVDVAFLGRRAYVLVALNGSDVGGTTPVGVYRVDGSHSFKLIADIGAYAQAHPPRTPFDLSQGVQYALQAYDGDLLVTDGHHNRVLRVTRKGKISVFRAFGNIVPTGLAVDGSTVYMARAGATPHDPADGRVHAFGPGWKTVATVATGAPLLVDVEFGGGRSLYALAQGTWNGSFPGEPAMPMTGSLVRLDGRGDFRVVAEPLNLPTSLEIVGKDAYVVTLTGEVWKLAGVVRPPFPRD